MQKCRVGVCRQLSRQLINPGKECQQVRLGIGRGDRLHRPLQFLQRLQNIVFGDGHAIWLTHPTGKTKPTKWTKFVGGASFEQSRSDCTTVTVGLSPVPVWPGVCASERSAAFTPLPRWTALDLFGMPGPRNGADTESALGPAVNRSTVAPRRMPISRRSRGLKLLSWARSARQNSGSPAPKKWDAPLVEPLWREMASAPIVLSQRIDRVSTVQRFNTFHRLLKCAVHCDGLSEAS